MVDSLLMLVFGAVLTLPVLGPLALYFAVRHGPLPHRWWQGETVTGFASTVMIAGAVLGVLVGGAVPRGGKLLPGLLMGAGALVGILIGAIWGASRMRAGQEAR
jgi:hypothetical protein